MSTNYLLFLSEEKLFSSKKTKFWKKCRMFDKFLTLKVHLKMITLKTSSMIVYLSAILSLNSFWVVETLIRYKPGSRAPISEENKIIFSCFCICFFLLLCMLQYVKFLSKFEEVWDRDSFWLLWDFSESVMEFLLGSFEQKSPKYCLLLSNLWNNLVLFERLMMRELDWHLIWISVLLLFSSALSNCSEKCTLSQFSPKHSQIHQRNWKEQVVFKSVLNLN